MAVIALVSVLMLVVRVLVVVVVVIYILSKLVSDKIHLTSSTHAAKERIHISKASKTGRP